MGTAKALDLFEQNSDTVIKFTLLVHFIWQIVVAGIYDALPTGMFEFRLSLKFNIEQGFI